MFCPFYISIYSLWVNLLEFQLNFEVYASMNTFLRWILIRPRKRFCSAFNIQKTSCKKKPIKARQEPLDRRKRSKSKEKMF